MQLNTAIGILGNTILLAAMRIENGFKYLGNILNEIKNLISLYHYRKWKEKEIFFFIFLLSFILCDENT